MPVTEFLFMIWIYLDLVHSLDASTMATDVLKTDFKLYLMILLDSLTEMVQANVIIKPPPT